MESSGKRFQNQREAAGPRIQRSAAALAAKVERLLSLPARRRLEEILNDSQPEHLVSQIAVEDFYLTVKELGAEEAVPLLRLASAEQRQYLTDLEFWDKERFDHQRALEWISLLESAGSVTLKSWIRECEPELLCLLLQRLARVHLWEQQEEGGVPPFFTLDQVYYVESKQPQHREVLERFLQALGELDLNYYHYLLHHVLVELAPELEDHLLHFRTSRLAEKGFADPQEALAVYTPLSPRELTELQDSGRLGLPEPQEPPALAPIFPLVLEPGDTLFRQAMSRLEDPVCLDRIKMELATLTNRVLVADGLGRPELERLKACLHKVEGYISIGLERLAGQGWKPTEQLLATIPLTCLFQVGLEAIFKVKWQAEQKVVAWLRQCDLPLSFLGEPCNGQLQGLLRKRPKHHRGGPTGAPLYEDFSRLEQIRKLQDTIRLARLVGEVLLGLMPAHRWVEFWSSQLNRDPQRLPLLTWRTVLLSSFARGVLFGRFFPGTLTLKQIRKFVERLWQPNLQPPRLAEHWRIRLRGWLAAAAARQPEVMEPLAAELCQLFGEELATLRPEDLNAGYLEPLFLLEEE